jgi:glycosyltransferase involved in cell wall biosynthesis
MKIKMKVTLIGTLPPIKALSPYCYHLADALSKKIDLEFYNFKSSLPKSLYHGGMKEKQKNKSNLKKVKIKSTINWWNPFSWIKVGLKLDGDILHVQHWALYSGIIYCFILPIIKIRKKTSIISVHNITPHVKDLITIMFDKIINKFIFLFADAFIVHNKRNLEKFFQIYNVDKKSVFIIPHGSIMPYQKIKNISKKDARKHLDISFDKKVILFFGYIWRYKGLDILLESLKIVKDKIKNVILIIAGQPLKDWEDYEKIIIDNDLNQYIHKKLDYITDSEIEYFFSSADLVVLPYKKHPFDTHGGVGALALPFKKPMIVTDVGGLPEYVKDKSVICESENAKELSKKIISVLNNDSILRKLSKDSEELAKELSWDKIADKTIEVYNKI